MTRSDSFRIVFMGTPEFAVPSMEDLIYHGWNVPAVVTVPDKPSGRGLQPKASAVKLVALKAGIPVLQPERLKDPEFLTALHNLHPDLFLVVAFRMLPAEVWKIPPYGTINLHASLLPDYRGAAPINHAIINGETRTGLTTFFIDENLDTGKIILQEETFIGPQETAGELHDRLKELGADLVLKTMELITLGRYVARSQEELIHPHRILHTAPKITKEMCRIRWDRRGQEVVNLIRGLSPVPGAYTSWILPQGKTRIKIYLASFSKEEHSLKPGTVVTDGKTFLKSAVPDGLIEIISLQSEGRKKLSAVEFLRGFQDPSAIRFDSEQPS